MRLEDRTYEIKPAPYTIMGRGLKQALQGVPHVIIETVNKPMSRKADNKAYVHDAGMYKLLVFIVEYLIFVFCYFFLYLNAHRLW